MILAQVWWSAPDPSAVHHPLLDDAERQRCAAFRQEADRVRHATARVLAKQVVAQRCDLTAEDVSIVSDPEPTKGRPRAVVRRPGTDAPWISITHAADAVGVALASCPCGLDVQDTAAITPLIGSDLVYSEAERNFLATLDDADRTRVACVWWVAKEAVLKAVGLGLSEPLPRVPGEGTEVRIDLGGRVRHLSRTEVTAPDGHLSALAVASPESIDLQVFSSAPSRIR